LCNKAVKTLEFSHKFRDRLDNYSKARQRAHCRTKGGRIHALAAGINIKRPHQSIHQALEQQLIKTLEFRRVFSQK
jgi:hypothetical protein